MRLFRVILEFLVGFSLITLLLFSIAGVVAVKFYGDELRELVMDQISERLQSRVDVEDIRVSVFRKFPNTSVVLTGTTVWSSQRFNTGDFGEHTGDTLIHAESAHVSFNPFSLLLKKYRIRQLEIENGSLYLLTDAEGNGNYHILKERDKEDASGQEFDLGQLRVSGLRIVLQNAPKQLNASGNLELLEVNGQFRKNDTRIRGTLKGILDEVSNEGILYASGREIRSRVNLELRDSVCAISGGQLQIDRILADIEGKLELGREKGVLMDLYASARDMDIHEVLDLLPGQLSTPLAGIRGNGILQLYARVTGVVSSTLTPGIEADFQTSRANLSWDRFPFAVKNLNLKGTYSNGGELNPATTSLRIESVSMDIGEDHLSGRGHISNFLDPTFSLDIRGTIHPGQWTRWYESLPVTHGGGLINCDLRIGGSYDRLNPAGDRFISFDARGNVNLEQVAFGFPGSGVSFTGLTGSVRINNDFWEPRLSGQYGDSDFFLEGSGLNLISFLLGKEDELMASAIFRSDHLDLGEVVRNLPRKGSARTEGFTFPPKVDLRLDFVVNDFVKDRLAAKSLRGVATYDAPGLLVDSLTMQTMEGMLGGRFSMIQDGSGEIMTSISADMKGLDIRELFRAFNSFGQTQITHEHLEGSITGQSSFSATFSDDFRIRTESILSETDIVLREGELNGFTPIMALSRFIDVRELERIRFHTLENTILIRDNQVIIPVMDIRSNALDLSASGTHGFDNRYDYRLRLLLSELLYNKARRSGNAEFVTADDASDSRTLFLKVYDNGSGASVEMDREKTAEKIRDDLKEEKRELKSILNQELGLFRKEEAAGELDDRKQEEVRFRFEFPAEEEQPEALPGKEREKAGWWRKRSTRDTARNAGVKEYVIDE